MLEAHVLPEVNIIATKENTTPDLHDEEDDENTQALQKLVKGKNPLSDSFHRYQDEMAIS